MVPINCFWAYSPSKIDSSCEWLKLYHNDEVLAAFHVRREGRLIKKKDLNMSIHEVARGKLSKLDVFISLRNSSTLAKPDKDRLWNWREKFFRIYPPDGHENYTCLPSRAHAKTFNEWLQTPDGIRRWMRIMEEVAFEHITANDVAEGFRSGNIKVN